MGARRGWVVAMVGLVAALGCNREKTERRELAAPLGPYADAGATPEPGLVIGEPGGGPQFSIRRNGAVMAGGTGMGLLWEPPEPEPPPPPTDLELHRDALVIDTHVDTTQGMADQGLDLTERHETGHLDLPRMREGGLDAAFFSIWVNPRTYRRQEAYERALRLFEVVHELDWRSPTAVVVDSARGLEAAVAAGQTALLLGVEGAHALGTGDEDEALERLRRFRALGARYMTVTWSNDNPFGHASTDDHPERGLTESGRRLIAEMERIGVIVDVSHVSDQTFWDIMAIATRPVLASHSSARALADHPRNMTDAMIRAVGEAGGAVCVNYFTYYIDVGYAAALERLEEAHPEAFEPLEEHDLPYPDRGAAYRAVALELDPALPVPDVDTIVDHIMHIVDMAGPRAACLGSDFDGVPDLPAGLEDVSLLPAVTAELRARGVSDDDIRAILGGNVLRVLSANEPGAEPAVGVGVGTGEGAGEGTGR